MTDERSDVQIIAEALKIALEVIVENWPQSGQDETLLAQARLDSVNTAIARLAQPTN